MINEFNSNYFIKTEVPNIIRREKQNVPDTSDRIDVKIYDWHDEEEKGNVKFIPCKTKFVADSIRDEFMQWSNKYCILIESPTGSGKSMFIIEKLLKNVVDQGKMALLVSDRIASSLQLKRIISKVFHCENELICLSEEGLRKKEDFGPITIKSYQKLGTIEEMEKMKSVNFRNPYDTVIFEEAQFFMSDSLIFPVSGELLSLTHKIFIRSKRIYISATFYDIGPEILKIENKLPIIERFYNPNIDYINNFGPICYTFDADYSFISARYFKKIGDLIDLILSDASNKKWLIFVDSIKIGELIRDKLGNMAVFITSLSKDSDKEDNKEYKNLIENEKFDKKVCIATSVINTSINIKDSDLCNVVIFSCDKVEFIQMLGRRRRLGEKDKLNLYIYDRSLQEITQRLNRIDKILSAIYWYEGHKKTKDCMAYFNKNYLQSNDRVSESIRKIFYYDIYGNFTYNNLALKKLKIDKEFLESLVYRMTNSKNIIGLEDTDNNELRFTNFLIEKLYKKDSHALIREILNWLGLLHTFNERNYISGQQEIQYKKEFVEFLRNNLNKPLDKKEQDEFGSTFKTLYNKAYGFRESDRPDRPIYRKEIMNSIFQSLNFNFKINLEDGIMTLVEYKFN